MQTEWYRKLTLTPLALTTIGVDPSLLKCVSEKIHKDDVYDVAHILGINTYILLNALYEPCESPEAIHKNLIGN